MLRECEHYNERIYPFSVMSIVAVALTFTLLILYSEPRCVELYVNTLTVLAIGAAFWASLQVLKRQKLILYELLRASWLYISTGLGLWLVAETAWLTYILLLEEPLELSVADIAWALGYAFMFAGLYRGVKPLSFLTKSTGLGHKMRLTYAIPLVLGTLLVAATLTEIPEAIAKEGLLTVVVDTSYVLLDIVLLTLSLKAVVFFWRGRFVRGPALFSVGLALLAVSDLPYFAIGGYYPGNPLDLLCAVSYIVMATGIYVYSKQPPVI